MTRLRKFAPGISWHRVRTSYHARVFWQGILIGILCLAFLSVSVLFVLVGVAIIGGPEEQIVRMETRR